MLGKLEIKHHRARHGYVLLSGQNFLKDYTLKISKYLKHGLAYVLLPCSTLRLQTKMHAKLKLGELVVSQGVSACHV